VNVQVIEQAIAALQEQLAVANARAERAEQRADAERARSTALSAELTNC
jgi:hypothetical protein